jgi:predicted esterase
MVLFAIAFAVYAISPQATDPAIARHLDDNVVIVDRAMPAPTAPLLVFMPGSGGRPAGVRDFLQAAASAGYRAIGLEYDDTPAVNLVCQRDSDPKCAQLVREKRIYGKDVTRLIDDLPAESIVNRLTKLLQYLAAAHPHDGWDGYLNGSALNWSRIAVSGHSQGAGMAAFIAKDHRVYRVILFSSPVDFHAPGTQLDAWLSQPSATPLDRWYGVYHAREPLAQLVQRAYLALGIPPSHVRALTLEPNHNAIAVIYAGLSYHASVVTDTTTPIASNGEPAYLPDWLFMLGKPQLP